jgi:hypothetical protein
VRLRRVPATFVAAISNIAHSGCLFVALGIQYAMPAPLYNIFQLYLINGTIFEKQN